MDTPGTSSAPSSAPKTYLVTGAAGFVGSEITRHLLARGDRVRAMARRSGQLDGMDHPNLDKVIGDVRDADALRKHAQGMDGIFHIAALFRQANVPDQAYWDTNVQGTRNVMDAAIAAGNLRMIYCSTCGVHGHLENPPANETAPYAPCDIYQETKVEAEKLVLEAYRSGRLPGVVIRPAMIYGPGDTRFRKMFRMIAKRRFFYVGTGDTLVHYLDNRDLARAFLLAMDHTERNGQAYIIAGERSMTLREFCEIVAAQLGVPPPLAASAPQTHADAGRSVRGRLRALAHPPAPLPPTRGLLCQGSRLQHRQSPRRTRLSARPHPRRRSPRRHRGLPPARLALIQRRDNTAPGQMRPA